jgi:hypothetical protein
MELPNQREKTVIQMYQYLRDVCTTKLLNTPIQLGNQDVVKANDNLNKWKVYHHTYYLDERMAWSLGQLW